MNRNSFTFKLLGTSLLIGSLGMLFYFVAMPTKTNYPAPSNNSSLMELPRKINTAFGPMTKHFSADSGNIKSESTDFAPYIAEIQRRIRLNWYPPRMNQSMQQTALFKIDRSGRLLSVRLKNPSSSKPFDDAALYAVRAASPFQPLPETYKGKDIAVQFTFNYNTFTNYPQRVQPPGTASP